MHFAFEKNNGGKTKKTEKHIMYEMKTLFSPAIFLDSPFLR